MSAATVFTIGDVAELFNKKYASGLSEAKRRKEEKGLWSKIMGELFATYGQHFDFSNLSDFRSEVEKARKNIKESKKLKVSKIKPSYTQLELSLKPWWYNQSQK